MDEDRSVHAFDAIRHLSGIIILFPIVNEYIAIHYLLFDVVSILPHS